MWKKLFLVGVNFVNSQQHDQKEGSHIILSLFFLTLGQEKRELSGIFSNLGKLKSSSLVFKISLFGQLIEMYYGRGSP